MSVQTAAVRPGFDLDEVVTSEPTRSARLKWVVVVDASIPAGRALSWSSTCLPLLRPTAFMTATSTSSRAPLRRTWRSVR